MGSGIPGDNGTAGAGTWLSPAKLSGKGEALFQKGGGWRRAACRAGPSAVFLQTENGKNKACKTSIIALVLAPAESPAAFPSLARFLFKCPMDSQGTAGNTCLGSGFRLLSIHNPVLYFGLCKETG